jgi:hypothetical protein
MNEPEPKRPDLSAHTHLDDAVKQPETVKEGYRPSR